MKSLTFAVLIISLAGAVAAAEPSRKIPPPDAERLKKSSQIVNEAYRGDFVKAIMPRQQRELAKKLLQDGLETTNDVVGTFALLTRAKDLAASAGDLDLAFVAAERLDQTYQIDLLTLKLDGAIVATRATQPKESLNGMVLSVDRLANEAVAQNRFEIARQACDLALSTARRSGDAALINHASQNAEWVVACAAAFEKLKAPLATLAKDSSDPEANLALGRYLCFFKGDWEGGLLNLAQGSDMALRALARKDLGSRDTPKLNSAEEALALADGWWALAEKEKAFAKTQVQRWAGGWYGKALPGLKGLSKARVEARLQAISAESSHELSLRLTLQARKPDWSEFGTLDRGHYEFVITGRVNLHDVEAAFIIGPAGREFEGHQIGNVFIKVNDKVYDSFTQGRDVGDGRVVTVDVAESAKLMMKVNDLTYEDNSGSYLITVRQYPRGHEAVGPRTPAK